MRIQVVGVAYYLPWNRDRGVAWNEATTTFTAVQIYRQQRDGETATDGGNGRNGPGRLCEISSLLAYNPAGQ